MLLRLAYLGITNAFALLRLLPGSDRDKDTEILGRTGNSAANWSHNGDISHDGTTGTDTLRDHEA
jgi:hypothetical protein